MFKTDSTITGLQETQAALNQALAIYQPRGAIGQAVTFVTTGLHSYAIQVTHVDTGALRASHRARIQLGNKPRGTVFIDGSARNPKTSELVRSYAAKEHRRGGEHAFYNRAISERGSVLIKKADGIIRGALPRGN